MINHNKELLATVLATEVASLAFDQDINKDLYDETYNFLYKNYMSLNKEILITIQKNILE